MPGLHGIRADDDPLAAMTALLDEAGYTSVVATNCDQAYHRHIELGEQLAVSSRLVDVTGPKRTALGEGWFVTTRNTWTSGGEPVADHGLSRTQVQACAPSRPGEEHPLALPGPRVIRPVVSPDTAFFWAGTAAGELRVQRCDGLRDTASSARSDVPVVRDHDAPARGTSWRPEPARSTATSCTITRLCPARSCRS